MPDSLCILLQLTFEGSKRFGALCGAYYFRPLQSQAGAKRHLITHFKVAGIKTLATACLYTKVTTRLQRRYSHNHCMFYILTMYAMLTSNILKCNILGSYSNVVAGHLRRNVLSR
jgi:hypothetical protein